MWPPRRRTRPKGCCCRTLGWGWAPPTSGCRSTTRQGSWQRRCCCSSRPQPCTQPLRHKTRLRARRTRIPPGWGWAPRTSWCRSRTRRGSCHRRSFRKSRRRCRRPPRCRKHPKGCCRWSPGWGWAPPTRSEPARWPGPRRPARPARHRPPAFRQRAVSAGGGVLSPGSPASRHPSQAPELPAVAVVPLPSPSADRGAR